MFEQQIDAGMKLGGKTKIIRGLGVDLRLELVAVNESIALPFQIC